ncbi:uncharacterized protein [Hetaerina americana]|uniref:uncharacterized protein n=1 Tax=Hetaerina americana TaxID=62018 RepID=UPI003A7F2AED
MGQIGKPLEGVYVRLGELSGNYHVRNKQMAELILGGDCVSQGYINLPDKADNFYTDGGIRWFHTGDAVIMHQDGSCELIDHKSDIIKLENGKCVPLGKLESIYRMSEYVDNIYLHGNEGGKFLVSILIPDKDYISGLALSFGLSITSFSQIYTELTIKTAVADLIAKHAKSCKLSAHEIPAAVMLVDHEWTIGSGLLTTNHQLKRSLVHEKYEAEIAFLYEELSKSQNNNDTKREITVIAGE